MAETVEAFACPKCGKIIEYGTHPCSFCGMPITWEGFTPPASEQTAVTSVANEEIGRISPSVELPTRGVETVWAPVETVRTPVVEEVPAVTAALTSTRTEPTVAFQQTIPPRAETSVVSFAQPGMPSARPSTEAVAMAEAAETSVSFTYPSLSQAAPFPSQQAETFPTSRVGIPPAPQIEVLSASQVRPEPAPQVEIASASWAAQLAPVPEVNAPAPVPLPEISAPAPAPAPTPEVNAPSPAPEVNVPASEVNVPTPASVPTLASVPDSIFAPDTEPSPVSIPTQTLAPAPLSVEALTPAPALNSLSNETFGQTLASDSAPDPASASAPDPALTFTVPPAVALAQDFTQNVASDFMPTAVPDVEPDASLIQTSVPAPAPVPAIIPTPVPDLTPAIIPTPVPDLAPAPAPAPAPDSVLTPTLSPLPSNPASAFGLTPEATSLYPSARADGQHFRPAESLYMSDAPRYSVNSSDDVPQNDGPFVERDFAVSTTASAAIDSVSIPVVAPAIDPVPAIDSTTASAVTAPDPAAIDPAPAFVDPIPAVVPTPAIEPLPVVDPAPSIDPRPSIAPAPAPVSVDLAPALAPIIDPLATSIQDSVLIPASLDPVPAPLDPVPAPLDPPVAPAPAFASEATTTDRVADVAPASDVVVTPAVTPPATSVFDIAVTPAPVVAPTIAPAPVVTPPAVPTSDVTPASFVASAVAPAPAPAVIPAVAPTSAPTPAPFAASDPTLAPTPIPTSAPTPTPDPATVATSLPTARESSISDEPVAVVNIPSGAMRRLPRRGAGASFLSVVLKAIAILIWLGTVLIIAIPGFDAIRASFSNDIEATLSSLLNNATVGTVLNGFIIGLVFFAIGEVIGLLNKIRRSAR